MGNPDTPNLKDFKLVKHLNCQDIPLRCVSYSDFIKFVNNPSYISHLGLEAIRPLIMIGEGFLATIKR